MRTLLAAVEERGSVVEVDEEAIPVVSKGKKLELETDQRVSL